MVPLSWFRRLLLGPSFGKLRASRAVPSHARCRSYRPRLEELEDRRLPSVTAVGDTFLAASSTGTQEGFDISPRAVAESPGGGVVEVWTDTVVVPDITYSIEARILRPDGTPLRGNINIASGDSPITLGMSGATVTMDATGSFIVAWTRNDQDPTKNGLFVQRLSADGTLLDGSRVADSGFAPSVAMDARGDFVVAWSDLGANGFDIFARRYDATGAAQGAAFPVNQHTPDSQEAPSVAMDAQGDFIVAWQSDRQDRIINAGYGVYARKYDSAGLPLSDEFLVNQVTLGDQSAPTVAMNGPGDFLVAWQSVNEASITPPSGSDIVARRFRTTDTAPPNEFLVNQVTTGDQLRPSAALDAAGDFVIGWDSAGQDGDGTGVFAREYSPAGIALGNELPVNQHTAGDQQAASVAMDVQGDFAVGWTDTNQNAESIDARLYLDLPDSFLYDGSVHAVTIAATADQNIFTYMQQSALDNVTHAFEPTYSLTLNGATHRFPDALLSRIVVDGMHGSNTAVLVTNDTYQDTTGATRETQEFVSLGSLTDPGVGTIQRPAGKGPPATFLTLRNFPTSYVYVGRNDGSVQLYGTAGVAFNGFVSAGNYSYVGGPGEFHLAQGATSVYGYSAGQATDFAYHYAADPGSSFVVSGTAFSYMSATDTIGSVTQSFFNVGVGFLVNTGVSKNPGQDFAYIIDSPGNDTFVGTTASSFMFTTAANGNFTEFDAAFGFALVFGQSFVGGTDAATNSDPARNILVGFRVR